MTNESELSVGESSSFLTRIVEVFLRGDVAIMLVIVSLLLGEPRCG
nr:hypothetical protein [Gimesia benthica]